MWISKLAFLALAFTQLGLAAPADELNKKFARDDNGLQKVVTWDKYSLSINGERLMIWSGEVHPWRLPVTGLWLDIMEKVKALGFNTISFYAHWGLVEYERGKFDFDGYRSYKPFFDAARKAGIYLIARPGPYINAETAGGGFPGWGTRVEVPWRSGNQSYFDAIEGYVKTIGKIVAEEQITKGGQIILVQPENEFSASKGIPWPQTKYMEVLQDWFREVGITVPMIENDVNVYLKNYVPGSGEGQVDIYGYDGYPQGFDCANPHTWVDGKLPTDWFQRQLEAAPTSPNSVVEFQGGAFDPWGGPSYEACSVLVNHEFERVFYKNLLSFSTNIFNVYMIFGGTNWGGLAFPGVYTSYDYGSAINEFRGVTREKYSELKLQANFLAVSPFYTTSKPQNLVPNTIKGAFTDNTDLAVTHVKDEVGGKTSMYVIRHAVYNSLSKSSYKWSANTSKGNFTVPRLGGSLTLDGRDSKIHVVDYPIGARNILYSTGEIFTWKTFGSKTVVVLYGSPGETHETSFLTTKATKVQQLTGTASFTSKLENGISTINYQTTGKSVLSLDGGNLIVYIMSRNEAYRLWAPTLSGVSKKSRTDTGVIIHGTYLVRGASIDGSTLKIRGDLNGTDTIEVFAPASIKDVTYNNRRLNLQKTKYGSFTGKIDFKAPALNLPVLKDLKWKSTNSLPEINSNYDDSAWPAAGKKTTTNPRKLTTPTSLYASDYGFHTGNHLFRGHFKATGKETAFSLTVQGGNAFGFSVWLNQEFLGSFYGYDAGQAANKTFSIKTKAGDNVITVLQDNQGLNEDWTAGTDDFKAPRGILAYSLIGSSSPITWKLTGNLGGENCADKARGCYNEGGLFIERQGLHLPGAPTAGWKDASPLDGISNAGVEFYKTDFKLNIPKGYDIPLAFEFQNCTQNANFRAQIYVNGYQFGKYANNVGPQTSFPVPEGILNHRGDNSLGVSLWAMDKAGAKLCGLDLKAKLVAETSYGSVAPSEQPKWVKRKGAY
ncbi:glycoside hydrolase family 35 protein [Pyronema domesticum]|uniref:beta-galactosidase n=1 Tax=Pyronema omphalodes (strain CBS 100304) TaxID=1076935 RepID=U4L6N4_PYROM|nr:glycoside hydrolase family 35 protein [Pyronema domesticum]CCX12140.1 Similar to Probable beta-galactosidase A; acc. no. A2QAN3 [Pyronema omphalodes CBS 100304]